MGEGGTAPRTVRWPGWSLLQAQAGVSIPLLAAKVKGKQSGLNWDLALPLPRDFPPFLVLHPFPSPTEPAFLPAPQSVLSTYSETRAY